MGNNAERVGPERERVALLILDAIREHHQRYGRHAKLSHAALAAADAVLAALAAAPDIPE